MALPQIAKLYSGDTLLVEGHCLLSLDQTPKRGVFVVFSGKSWTAGNCLRLVLSDGTQYRIVPTRYDVPDGAPACLYFTLD